MDWLVTVISSLITGGVGASVATIYSARKSAQVGMNGNEVEAAKAATADWATFTEHTNKVIERQDNKIRELEKKVEALQNLRFADLLQINVLENHINDGKGPPAPARTNQNGSTL